MRLLLILIIVGCCIASCTTREQIQADIYQHDAIPAKYCVADSPLWNYGMYRVVTCASKPTSAECQHGEKSFEEFRSYCEPSMKDYLAMSRENVLKYLGELNKPK